MRSSSIAHPSKSKPGQDSRASASLEATEVLVGINTRLSTLIDSYSSTSNRTDVYLIAAIHECMDNPPLNLTRAVCVAAGLAEADDMPSTMQAVFLQDYVKDLSQIQPSAISRPDFSTFRCSPKNKAYRDEPLLRVRITHSAINHVDLLYAHGNHQNNKSGLFTPPFTIGLEFSGIVVEIDDPSAKFSAFRVGDRVWGGSIGCHAEEIVLPAATVHHLPGSWSLHDIAAIGAGTLPVSYGALTTIADVRAGELVLVHAAAGGLGVYAVQIARALGARVIGTVGSKQKQLVVEDLLRDPKTGQISAGEGVVNYSEDGWEQKVVALAKQIGKDGVDVVYDTVGLVQRSIKCTTFNGRIVVVGFAGRTGTGAEKVQPLEKLDVNRVLLKQIKLLGYRYGETSRRLPHETVKMWQGLNKMLAQEPAVIRPVVYKTYPGLQHVNEALKAVHERKVYGKAVIEIADEKAILAELGSSKVSKL